MCIISNIRGKNAIVFKRLEQIGLLTLADLKKKSNKRIRSYFVGFRRTAVWVQARREKYERAKVSSPPTTRSIAGRTRIK